MHDTQIIDADRHVSEPMGMWKDYLDPKFRAHAPQMRTTDTSVAMAQRIQVLGPRAAVPLLPEITIDNRPLFANWGVRFQVEASRQARDCASEVHNATNPQGQIKSMDASGIAAAYLFPTHTTFLVNHEDVAPPVSAAFARAYNRWLFDYCAHDPRRLRAVGVLSRHDHTALSAELERVAEYGWKCVVLRPEPILGSSLGDPRLEPFWTRCEQLGIAVAIHGSTHLFGPTTGRDRFSTRFALHACSHPIEAQMAFLSLLEAGVFERHPKLRVAFLEAGASWVPHWLWRLDEICYATMPGEVADNVRMKPSEYFARQCWVGIELEEPCTRQVIEMVGAERLLYGTDYPHPDHLQFVELTQPEHDRNAWSLDAREQKLVFECNPKAFFEGAH